eukprot:2355974-Rhodomonas_salina.6
MNRNVRVTNARADVGLIRKPARSNLPCSEATLRSKSQLDWLKPTPERWQARRDSASESETVALALRALGLRETVRTVH